MTTCTGKLITSVSNPDGECELGAACTAYGLPSQEYKEAHPNGSVTDWLANT